MTYAWVFPGQGAQAVGMGADLYNDFDLARRTFDEANAELGFDLARLCFEGPEETLTATEHAQLAILTMSVALLRIVRAEALLPAPSLVAGHSLGEYSALVAADALTFADALRLVRRRGELMAQASEGTMAAVIGLDLEPLQAICASVSDHGPCVVANQNAPGQLVISGSIAAVQAAGEQARAAGAKRIMPLKVSAAFHSPLMHTAAQQLALTINSTPISPASIPVVANTDAQPISSPAELRQELAAQVEAPVRWISTIETCSAHGVTSIVELGPGAVLSGLVKRIAPSIERRSINTSASIHELQTA